MSLDYSQLRSLTVNRLIRALERDGFRLHRQRGSHRRYIHGDGRRVTVPYHSSGSALLPKTLRSIIGVQAQWMESDLHRLGLLK